MFPAGPVLRLLLDRAVTDRIPLTELALQIRLPRRTLYRVLGSTRLRWDTADRVAVALGRHPSEIWPNWFEEVSA
jgi:lambda repressor-like predicted transcriptional regulator